MSITEWMWVAGHLCVLLVSMVCRLSLVVESGGCSLVVMHKLLIVVAVLVMEHML